MRRVLGAVGTSTGVLSTVFAAGWTGVVLILAVVVVLTAAVCWVVADAERPARLAMLLRGVASECPTQSRSGLTPADPQTALTTPFGSANSFPTASARLAIMPIPKSAGSPVTTGNRRAEELTKVNADALLANLRNIHAALNAIRA